MTTGAVAAFIVSAILLLLVAGLQTGFDLASLALFGLIVAAGALAVAVARKKDAVPPEFCRECHRVVSPNAPYCKHCGARARR